MYNFLDELELERFNNFIDDHVVHGYNHSTKILIEFQQTGVGLTKRLYCLGCNKITNITNYDTW